MSAPPGAGRRLQELNGCLTDAGLRAMERAPLGRAPAELAAHLGGCPRCQERLLAREAGRAPGEQLARKPPPLWRSFVVAGGVLLLCLAALPAARCLSGR